MKHIHFKEIASTQNYLRDEISNLIKLDHQILVSADFQSQGIGRKENKWIDSDGSIAFSCVIPSTEKLSLIPLWASLIVSDFFKKEFSINLQLKWPNDLYYNNKKCGGIICHKSDDFIIIGIGVNLTTSPHKLADNNNVAGDLAIDPNSLENNFKEKIPFKIYQHILAANFDAGKIPELFKQQCLYMGDDVKISDDTDLTKGKFVGIGEWGEALVRNEETKLIAKIYNGSMRKKD